MQEVVVCPNCRTKLGIPDNAAEQLIECPSCHTVFSSGPRDVAAPVSQSQHDDSANGFGAALDERHAGAERGSSALAWVITYVVVSALAGGVGLLTWHLTHDSTAQEVTSAPEREQFPDVGPNEESTILSANKDAPPVEFKQFEPTKAEPKKEVLDPPKGDVPEVAAAKKEKPANIEARPKEPPKDEIIIGADGWFEVHCLRGRFHVALPAVPVAQLTNDADSNDVGPEYMAKHPAADLVFRAGATQKGVDASLSPSAPLRSVVKRQFPDIMFDLTTEKDIVHDGVRGHDFLAVGFNKVRVVGRYFRIDYQSGKPRFIWFTAIGPGVSRSAPDVRRFLQSVKFDKGERDIPKGDMAGAKKDPRGEPKIPDTKVSDLKKPDDSKGSRPRLIGDVGEIAGKLNAHVGAVIDLEAKAALLILPAGQIKLFDYPHFKALGAYKLGGGTAYQPVYDKDRGRLFALTPNVKAKDPAGKSGGSQVLMYEIRGLLDGKFNPNSEVTPARTIPLGGFCSRLCLSPDGAWLYALESGNPKAIKVVRVNVATGTLDGALPMPEFTERLNLARDGKVLYALSHLTARTAQGPPPQGAILVVDPGAMKLLKTINIPVDPFAMEVTRGGIAFVSGHGGVRGEIIVVDTAGATPVVALWKGVTPD
ncbi:MAG TPA: hypothetical protein VNX28_03560, partial [Gemmataceae bacterium]|nr:hypothetical protein [Gemmataceae bacterium]